MDFDDFLRKYSWHNWPPNGSSSSHLTQRMFLHYLGKTEQTKYALKWTTNVNKLEIRSHKNLITAVWANEVHRLLTYCSTSCYQMRRWWHVRVSAVQRIGSWSDRTVGVRNLRLHLSRCVNSPDLNLVDYKLSGIMQQRVYQTMWMNSRSNRLKSGLVWSKNIIDTAINEWRKRLRACVHAKGRHFEHLL